LSIIQGPFSVAPCQTLIPRFATFSSLYAGGRREERAQRGAREAAWRGRAPRQHRAEGGEDPALAHGDAAAAARRRPLALRRLAAAVRRRRGDGAGDAAWRAAGRVQLPLSAPSLSVAGGTPPVLFPRSLQLYGDDEETEQGMLPGARQVGCSSLSQLPLSR
jgi:hypothetical protein